MIIASGLITRPAWPWETTSGPSVAKRQGYLHRCCLTTSWGLGQKPITVLVLSGPASSGSPGDCLRSAPWLFPQALVGILSGFVNNIMFLSFKHHPGCLTNDAQCQWIGGVCWFWRPFSSPLSWKCCDSGKVWSIPTLRWPLLQMSHIHEPVSSPEAVDQKPA